MNDPGERTRPIGHGRFDPLSGDLSLDGRSVRLRPRTAALLDHLLQHGDRVVGKDELLQAVWPDVVVTEDSLVQCVKEIRQALGPAGRDWIRTVPRQGYAFVGEPTQPAVAPEEPVEAARAPAPGLHRSRWRWPSVAAAAAVVAVGAAGAFAWRWSQPEPDTHAAPPLSIVVMPIVNATGHREQDNAADDLTDALTDALARTAGTTVISSGTAFTFKGQPIDARKIGSDLNVRYVLEGSLRLDAAQPVLTMRLADAASAVQLWNQEFRAGSEGALRDVVAGRVAATLGFHMVRAETRPDQGEHTRHAAVADLLSEARAVVRRSGVDDPNARKLLEAAMRSGDDHDAEGLAMLATSYAWANRFSPTRGSDLAQAQLAIERALALAPDNDKVRVAEGRVYGEVGNQARSLAAYDRAVALNPNNAEAHGGRADALVMLGRPEEAFAPIEQAMRISPYDPRFFVWEVYAGVAHLHLRHDTKAVELFTKVVRAHPHPFFHLLLAGALGASGRIAEAREQMAAFRAWYPRFTLSQLRAIDPSEAPAFFQQRQHLYDGLRAAGMPE